MSESSVRPDNHYRTTDCPLCNKPLSQFAAWPLLNAASCYYAVAGISLTIR